MMIKRVFKILSLIVTSVIILLILIFILIRTGFLNNYIAGTVSKIAGKSLNGELEIGSLKGNIFSSFSIHDIVITFDSDTILRCDEIEVRYLPFSLLSQELDISRLYIDNLSVNLSQNKDSVWNFMNLLKRGEAKDTTPVESVWIVNLRDFRLTKLAAGINPVGENQLIPEFITSDIRLGAFMSGDILKVNLDKLTLVTRNPDFLVTDFTGTFSKTGDMINWEKTELRTAQSVVITGGKYVIDETGEADLEIEFDPLSFREFLVFFAGTELHGSPEISASLKGEAKHYYFDVNITEQEQVISIEGSMKNFRTDPEFSLNMVVENLDGSYWTGNEKMKSLISGVLDLTGRGFDIKENDLVVSGKFGDLRYGDYILSDLVIRASKQKDNVVGSIGFNTVAGNLSLGYDIDRIFSNPAYDLHGRFRNVNPEVFMEMDSLETALNGYFAIKGEGISPETAEAEVEIRLENSEFVGESVDFSILADYNKGDYEFELKDFGTPFFTVSAGGDGNIYRSNRIDFEFQPLDLAGLAKAFNLPEVNATGRITGRIEGTTDSLSASGEMSLAEIMYDSISVKELNSDIKVLLADSLYNIVLNAGGIRYKDMSIRSASLNASMSGRSVTAGLEITVNDSLDAVFSGEIDGFNDPLIKIGLLEIGYNGTKWISRNDSSSIHLGKDNIFIDSFSLISGDQALNVHGRLSFDGDQDLSISIDDLKLESLPLYLFTPMDISGILSLKTDITGNSKEPVVKSNINIDDIVLNKYRIDSVRSESAYKNEMLTFAGAVSAYGYRLVDISADLPVHISLGDSVYILKDSQAFSVSVNIDSVDLKLINEMFPVDNTSFTGMAEASLNITNKVSRPEIKGNLGIRNARFENTEYGALFDNIRIESNIDSNIVTIEEFTATSGKKGTISIQGAVGVSDAVSIDPSSLGLSIRADDFQLMKSEMAELNFDSDLSISGESGKPTFGGEITINNAEVNVDYFGTYLSEVKDDPNPPLLIEALGDTITGPLTINDTLMINPGMPGAAFFKNLTGEALLNIPGNTWARGKDMNAELQGTLRVIKSGEGISLFGDININRGFYKLYGKRFDFSRGKVSFTGGSELNPNLDFEIIYKFRDFERELKNMKLTVKGKLNEPELGFSLDDRVLEEKDAISYIVFGRSINELSDNERSKVAGNEVIAMNAALSGLASVLKDVLQQSAGLDVVEISGEEDWKSTNVTIGKYITNKLYLSYEQSFAFDKQTKVVDTEKFMLEYQILRNLILKATNQEINSGFDLIFRKKWK